MSLPSARPTPRLLVVDDEPLARRRVAQVLLAAYPGADVDEARHGRAALERLDEGVYDAMTLDVEMPGMGAFDLVRAMETTLPTERRPEIVIVTAFDHYTLDAFDAGAIDYVLKPIDARRLEQALDRALLRRGAARAASASPLAFATSEHRPFLTRIAIRQAGRIEVVATDEIEWVEARGSYVLLHVRSGAEHLYRSSLKGLADDLDPAAFQRVHRSALVALSAVVSVEPAGHGDAVIRLRSGTEVPLGRRHRARVLEALDGSTQA